MATIEPGDALRIVLEKTSRLTAVKTALAETLGCVLAEDITAQHDMPPFDNSAMDGYAVLAADIAGASEDSPVALKLVEEQPAGKATDVRVVPGTAIKIMTGAPVPGGADTVVPVEKTAATAPGDSAGGAGTAGAGDAWAPAGGSVSILSALRKGANIRPAGEEMKSGDTALAVGTVVDYVVVGVLASLGYPEVAVFRRPVIAVIGTGNELVPVDEPLSPGKIRDSNSYALTAQAASIGAVARRMGVAGDTKDDVDRMVREALETADIVITSGGVSVGDHDYVKAVIEKLGAERHFWGVRQKPGKPLAFWTLGSKLIFGLPGNPVAGLFNFEEYVRPAALKMMGRGKLLRPVVTAALTHDYKKKAGRTNFVGAVVTNDNGRYQWSVNGRQGSGMLRSITGADGLAVIPAEVTQMRAGDETEIQLTNFPEDH